MQEFQKVNDFYCKKAGHVKENIILICTHPNCQSRNRFLCFKCLENKQHHDHIEECIQYYFVLKFIKSSCRIVEQMLQLQFYDTSSSHNNHKCFKLFFEKKIQQLQQLKTQFNDINFVKNHLGSIEFAYNILSLSKQFIKGFPQLIEQNFIIQQLDNIFRNNCTAYVEEFSSKAQILKSHFYYEESIRCCDRYLDLILDGEILCLKAVCLHFLDCLDEAQEIFELAEQLDPQNEKIVISQFFLFHSRQNIQMNYLIQSLQQPIISKTLKAKQLFEEKKLNEALLLLNECLNENPENFIAATIKGKDFFFLLYLGRKTNLLKSFKTVSKILLEFDVVIGNLGMENKDSELYELLELNKSKFNPIDRAAILCKSYLKLKQYQKVQKLLDEIPENMRGNTLYRKLRSMLSAHSLIEQNQEPKYDESFKSQDEQLQEIIADFTVLINQLRLDEAFIKIEEGLGIDPKNLDCLQFKAYILYARFKIKEAREIYDFMKKISPNCNQVKNLESQLIYIFERQPSQQNFELKLENLHNLYQQANDHQTNKQYDQAIKIYKKILSIDTQQLKAQLQEILCYIYNKQIDYALYEIENRLRKNNCLQVLQLKGFAMFKKGEFEKALTVFEQIEEINPNYLLLEFSKANCFFKLKQYDIALQIYETMCEQTSYPRQIQSLKMRIYKTCFANNFQISNKKNQILKELINDENFRKQFSDEGKFCDGLLCWTCVILLKFGLPQQQKANFLKQKMQNSEIVQLIYAKTMFALGKIDISIQVYDLILQQNPKYLLALVGITEAFLQQNHSPTIIESYKNQALKINSKAFDNQVQDEILIQDLEDLFEKDVTSLLIDQKNYNLFSMVNMYF